VNFATLCKQMPMTFLTDYCMCHISQHLWWQIMKLFKMRIGGK